MVKHILIQLEDKEHIKYLKAKGELTWKKVLERGLEELGINI